MYWFGVSPETLDRGQVLKAIEKINSRIGRLAPQRILSVHKLHANQELIGISPITNRQENLKVEVEGEPKIIQEEMPYHYSKPSNPPLPVRPLGGSIDISHKSISTIPSATNQYTTINSGGHIGHQPAPYSEVIKHLPHLPVSFYCLRSKFCFSHSGNVMSTGELLEHNTFKNQQARLEVGLMLALELAKLHETALMAWIWGEDDIFFFLSSGMGIGEYGEYGATNRVHEPVLTGPLLHLKFDPSQNQMPSARTQNSTYGDELFLRSLELLLAELWLGQRAGSNDSFIQSIEREAGPR